MSKSSDTRRLYKFEASVLIHTPAARVITRLAAQRLVNKVCRHATYAPPDVIYDHGTLHGVIPFSYCNGPELHMAPTVGQFCGREVGVLLHEVTHFLGHDDHDGAFTDRYFDLLRKYGGVNPWPLWRVFHKYPDPRYG